MSNAERVEVEHIEVFNKADCIRFTVQNFAPSTSFLGRDIQARYLGIQDIYTSPSDSFKRSKTNDEAIKGILSTFPDPGVDLTESELSKFKLEAEETERSFGPDVLNRAQELGLTTTLYALAAKEKFDFFTNLTRVDIESSEGSFNFKGWSVASDTEFKQPYLLIPQNSSGDLKSEGTVSAVNLDELFVTDPEFLTNKLKSLNEKSALGILAFNIEYNLQLHEINPTELIPDFIEELMQITDPEERKTELYSIQQFLKFICSLGEDFTNSIQNLQDRLLAKGLNLDKGESVFIDTYLSHMAKCPEQNDNTRQQNESYAQTINAITTLDSNVLPINRDHYLLNLLRNPAFYILNLDSDEQEIQRAVKINADTIQFIIDTLHISAPSRIVEILSERLPDFHQTLINFKEWLDESQFGESKLDHVLSVSAYTLMDESEEFDYDNLQLLIGKKLLPLLPLNNENFDGISAINYTNESNSTVKVYNDHLRILLPLLVLKTAQEEAKSRLRSDPSPRERVKKVNMIQNLTQDFLRYLRRDTIMDVNDQLLLDGRRRLMESVKDSFDISDYELSHIYNLSVFSEDEENFEPEFDPDLYTILFNALLLTKRKEIDMNKPSFKKFLKEILPNVPESVWVNL